MSVLCAEPVSGVSTRRVRISRWAGSLLILTALVLLLVVPIRTAPANVAKDCGRLLEEPGGKLWATPAGERGFLQPLLQEQRLEAVCEDAAAARWIYVGVVTAGLGLAVWRAVRSGAGPRSRLLALLVAVAALAGAVFDGPPVLLGLAVVGLALSVWSSSVTRGAQPGESLLQGGDGEAPTAGGRSPGSPRATNPLTLDRHPRRSSRRRRL